MTNATLELMKLAKTCITHSITMTIDAPVGQSCVRAIIDLLPKDLSGTRWACQFGTEEREDDFAGAFDRELRQAIEKIRRNDDVKFN